MNGNEELDELASDIRKIIDDNRKFLDRILDDDFEPEVEEDGEEEVFEEL